MKVSELEGDQLDYWVAIIEGHKPFHTNRPATEYERAKGWHWNWLRLGEYGSAQETPRYSRDWAHGGPIIDKLVSELRFGITPSRSQGIDVLVSSTDSESIPFDDDWKKPSIDEFGSTVLVAACRAYVAMKFGDTVPDEA